MTGTCSPSIDPMLMTRAGSSSPLAASRVGRRNFVRWKTPFTLRSSTRSHAASSNSSIGVPQVAPALFTRMWSAGSRSAIWPASVRQAVLRGEVGRDRLAGPDGGQLGRHLLADVGLAGGDVDPHAGLDEAPGDHQPDAAAAPGHEGDLAVDGEQVVHSGDPTRVPAAGPALAPLALRAPGGGAPVEHPAAQQGAAAEAGQAGPAVAGEALLVAALLTVDGPVVAQGRAAVVEPALERPAQGPVQPRRLRRG